MIQRLLTFLLLLPLVVACERGAPLGFVPEGDLIVLTRTGATTYGTDEQNGSIGFEHDLVQLFAEEIGMRARFQIARSDMALTQRLLAGEAHFAAAWLSAPTEPGILAGPSYYSSHDVLVQHEASLPFDDFKQLQGKTVAVLADSRQHRAAERAFADTPGIYLRPLPRATQLELMQQVSEQRIDVAIIDAAAFAIGANYYPMLQEGMAIGGAQAISWHFPQQGDATLLLKAQHFFARITQDGTLARLKDRHFGHVARLNSYDVVHFLERMRERLPEFRHLFQQAQASTGIDWRLLAALAYQESAWDPLATSPTGVRGIMMLTEDTADRMGVSNRLDPKQSIRAGAEYLIQLRNALPDSIPEPDRTWLTTAAYNLGLGHLNGARSIARRLNKDANSWYEMKSVLPLLSKPEYYKRLKSGRARGGEAVILTENVRIYYDILSRHEPAYRPRLTATGNR